MKSRGALLGYAILGLFTFSTIFTVPAAAQWNQKEAEAAFQKADLKLNTAYRGVLAKIKSSNARDDFKKAQRAWISFRDAESTSTASVTTRGGIVWAATEIDERARLTLERTRQFEALLARDLQ